MLACSALTACASASNSDFPSLAIRPGERASGTIEPVAAPVPPPATAATGGRLSRLRDTALAAHRRFGERRGRASQLTAAAQGAPIGSEAWSVAQVALADDAAAPTGGSGDLDAIAAARDEVTRLIAEEDAVLLGLRQRLPE
jgi:hypothetical protein